MTTNLGTPQITVDRLTLRHLGRRRRCLDAVSLTINPGERVLIVGPSGAGKSSLALVMNGLIPSSIDAHWVSGDVRIDGVPTREIPTGDLTRRVGLLFQDPEAQVVLSHIDEDVAFGLENRAIPRSEMPARIARARQMVGVDGARIPNDVTRLSGGAKQRLALAGLLAVDPDVLVLDEPVANIDPVGAAHVWATVAAVVADRRRSLIVVEHTADDVLPLLDRVIVLDHDGRVVATGTPDAIFLGERARLQALGIRLPIWATIAFLAGSPFLPRSDAEAGAWLATWARRYGENVSPPNTNRHRPIERDHVRPWPAASNTSLRSVGFRHGGATWDAVRGVTLTIEPGELVAIVGANGAGKSTIGLLLAGVLTPTRGAVLLDGRPLASVSTAERARRLRYVFQYPEHQFIGQTVRSDLEAAVAIEKLSVEVARARVDESLRIHDLVSLTDANPFTLSHGQKRRLSVASALLTDPDLAILDEPTFGQDDAHAQVIMTIVAERVARGRSVVVITHDLDLVAEHATRVIAMCDGEIAFDGIPADLMRHPEIVASCALRPSATMRVVAHVVDAPEIVASLTCRRDLERLHDAPMFAAKDSPPLCAGEGLGVGPVAPLLRTGEGLGVGPVAPPPAGIGWVGRRNPTVGFATVILVGFAMTFVIDPVTPLLWFLVQLVIARSTGISLRVIGRALRPVAVIAIGLLWSNAVFAALPPSVLLTPDGVILWQAGPMHLTWHGVRLGLAFAIRGLATATTGLIFVLAIDPTTFVISLIHHARLPYRWGYAILAGYRFLPGITEELAQVRLARRVRGEDATEGVWRRLGTPFRELRLLLTVAILRATRLAVAMDARGFAGTGPRTYFRVVSLTSADALFALGTLALLAGTFTLSMAFGTFRSWGS